jgi:hypothetical protein
VSDKRGLMAVHAKISVIPVSKIADKVGSVKRELAA